MQDNRDLTFASPEMRQVIWVVHAVIERPWSHMAITVRRLSPGQYLQCSVASPVKAGRRCTTSVKKTRFLTFPPVAELRKVVDCQIYRTALAIFPSSALMYSDCPTQSLSDITEEHSRYYYVTDINMIIAIFRIT